MSKVKKYAKTFLEPIGIWSFLKRLRNMSNKLFTILEAFKYYFYNSFLTNFPSYSIRNLYLRNVLKITIGKDTAIHMGCFFAGANIEIGTNTVIARNCYIDGRSGLVKIHNNVSIAPDTHIISMTHDANSPIFATISKPVIIEDYVWIGTRATILLGVTLREGSVVGAASVVTKDVEQYTIVVGSPAKSIGLRNKNLKYKLSYFSLFNSDITVSPAIQLIDEKIE